ncbi:MAG: AMP-binding protein [Rhodobacter sp.]|nr:AMP-binding protein [Rhodobacter sp.]
MTRQDPEFPAHSVTVEARADGSLILRSGRPLGPVARDTGVWLHRWAEETPNRVFVAERDGDGWREVTYAEMLALVRRTATGLLRRDLGRDRPIAVISGPSVDHAVLTLAAQYAGIPTVPLAEQYAVIPQAHGRLRYCVGKTAPGMVYAADGARFREALSLEIFDGVERVVSTTPGTGMTVFSNLATHATKAVDAAYSRVGPDTLAKILFTSGSTSDPKGVPQTQRMMCVNQAQYLACLPILGAKPHKMLDWLPWNHVFAGSSNFNMMLSNGGSLYLDDGKPTGPLAERSIENMKMHQSTLNFDVPVAHAMQVAALHQDAELRRKYFDALDIFFYAGASLPSDVWSAVEEMSLAETGTTPMMMSSWGLTETAPSALIYHEKGAGPGMVGVPVPGLEAKLIPQGDNRFEIRVRGPNVFAGYFDDPARSVAAFDDEGFFITGDAMRFVDPGDATRGLRFDGRIGEDFKLVTGTWVQASTLRLNALAALAGQVADIVVVGEGRSEIGLLIFPPAGLGLSKQGGVVENADYAGGLRAKLQDIAATATGSSNRITRALVMAEPPHVGDGEITAKGSLNVRTITLRRKALLDRLYDDRDPAVIHI